MGFYYRDAVAKAAPSCPPYGITTIEEAKLSSIQLKGKTASVASMLEPEIQIQYNPSMLEEKNSSAFLKSASSTGS